jgi:hypothetical protein
LLGQASTGVPSIAAKLHLPLAICSTLVFCSNMKAFGSWACAAAALVSGVSAASYDDIPEIEVYGQHFFYTNNGSQLYVCAKLMVQDG